MYRLGESLTPRYKVLDFMGEGTFARVLECWDRKEKRHVAIKVVRAVEKYTESAAIEKQIILKVMEAADRLLDRKEFTHCIQLIDDFMFRGHFCLVYPKCGRSLYDFLRRNRYRGFSSECLFHLSRQLVEAIAFLHNIDLIHTDLKPENILFTTDEYIEDDSVNPTSQRRTRCLEHAEAAVSKGTFAMQALKKERSSRPYRYPASTDIKVIDFGSAIFQHEHHSKIISTRHYRAPEVIFGEGVIHVVQGSWTGCFESHEVVASLQTWAGTSLPIYGA